MPFMEKNAFQNL